MSPAKLSGVVLRWQALLIAGLVEVGPPNQTRILAVAAACVSHANPDGSRMEAGIRRLARETGQHYGRAQEALSWLIEEGWLTFDRRIARGGRRLRLTFPQRSGESNAGNTASDPVTATLATGQRSGQRSGEGNEPPTSDHREEEEERTRPAETGLSAHLPRDSDRSDQLIDFDAGGQRSTTEKKRPEPDEVAQAAEWRRKTIGELVRSSSWSVLKLSDVDPTNADLIAACLKLDRGGWTLGDLKLSDYLRNPPATLSRPTGWLLKFLRELPDSPSADPSIAAARLRAEEQANAEREAEEEQERIEAAAVEEAGERAERREVEAKRDRWIAETFTGPQLVEDVARIGGTGDLSEFRRDPDQLLTVTVAVELGWLAQIKRTGNYRVTATGAEMLEQRAAAAEEE